MSPDHHPMLCGQCGASWWVPSGEGHRACPCDQAPLVPSDGSAHAFAAEELVLARIDRSSLARALQEHVGNAPFLAKELSVDQLRRSAALVWWPRWLLDVTVRGSWSANVGFRESVTSHVDRLEAGRWVSRSQSQERTRWERRAGRLDRRLHNVLVAALDGQTTFERLHRGCTSPPIPADSSATQGSWVRLPDLSTAEAETGANPSVRRALAAEITRATRAESSRELSMRLQSTDHNWTLRLQPTWMASYQLDGQTHVLYVDAVTGRAAGPVFASLPRAYAWSAAVAATGLIMVATAIIAGLVGLLFPPALLLAAALTVVGFLTTVGAIWPVARASAWNARQRRATPRD